MFSGAGFNSFNCRINAFGLPSGVSASENARRFFNFNDRATISAVCRARRNGLERIRSKSQIQVLHGGGDLPELTSAFGRERAVGVRFEPGRAAFHRDAMPQKIQIHGRQNTRLRSRAQPRQM